jgi:hypothetical protein
MALFVDYDLFVDVVGLFQWPDFVDIGGADLSRVFDGCQPKCSQVLHDSDLLQRNEAHVLAEQVEVFEGVPENFLTTL